jgi:hypothetical protein
MEIRVGDLFFSELTNKTWRVRTISELTNLCLLNSNNNGNGILITQKSLLPIFYKKLVTKGEEVVKNIWLD